MMLELTPLTRVANWFATGGDDSDVVISSRVRLARNLSDFPYPPIGSATGQTTAETSRADSGVTQAVKLLANVIRSELMPDVLDAESVDVALADLDPEALELLVERRLVDDPLPARVFVSADELLTLELGGQDHLRLSVRLPGVQALAALSVARSVDKTLEQFVNYAVSIDLGYLSTSITNLGTAFRVSCLLHLPALAALGRIEEIQTRIKESDFDLVPDEQLTVDDGETSVWRLFNRRTLGLEEDAVAAKLEDHASALVHYERLAREELVSSRGAAVADAANRALGILRHARHLGEDETLTLLSSLRLGIVSELVGGVTVQAVTALFFLSRENHVRAVVHQTGETDGNGEENIQLARATLIRKALAG